MKSTITILTLFLLVLACSSKDNKKKELIDKPIQHLLSFRLIDNKFVEYNLDTLKNFNEILKVLDEVDCRKEYALFNLETDDKIYKIQPLQSCENIIDYKLREILYVNSESITVNYDLKYPIDSLKVVLNNHINNTNGDENYPSTNHKKLISINLDSTKNITEIKNLLIEIITNVNETQNKELVNLMFEKRGIFPKPIYK